MLRHSIRRPIARGQSVLSSMTSLALFLALVALTPAVIAAPADAPAAQIVQPALPAGTPVGADWTTYGGNLFSQRFSSLTQITTDNVSRLKGVCTFNTTQHGVDPGFLPGSSFESTPLVVAGTMYLTGPQSQVWALDATTRKERWPQI